MFIVYDKDMNKKEFPQGVRPLDIFISSIQKEREITSVEGRNGIVTTGQTYGTRPPIEVRVKLEAEDTRDYRLLRDEVFSFFNDDEYFYVSELYERGKRYKVNTFQSSIPDRINQEVAQAEFLLEQIDLPYAESIGTTQDIQQNGISADDELWGYGMGLLSEDDSLVYTHNASNGVQFAVYNAGNVAVHPFEQELKITISNVVGGSAFKLTNDTNGTEFEITESVSNSQTIVIDGANITSNGLAYLRKTNRKYIVLSPGWNYFTLTGVTSATIAYDFRFYYK